MAAAQQDPSATRNAFRFLQNTVSGTDLASNWQWWLFASSVGSLTGELIGPGIAQAVIRHKWPTGVELRVRRIDESEATLQITRTYPDTYRTRVISDNALLQSSGTVFEKAVVQKALVYQ